MKFAFMKQHSYLFTIERMSKVFKVSRSGYYSYTKGKISKRARENAQLLEAIKAAYEESRGIYGSPRIHAVLKTQGEKVSLKRVARLMRESKLVARKKQRFKVTTKVDKRLPVAENLLQRNFKAQRPNQKWVSDITYIWTS